MSSFLLKQTHVQYSIYSQEDFERLLDPNAIRSSTTHQMSSLAVYQKRKHYSDFQYCFRSDARSSSAACFDHVTNYFMNLIILPHEV